MAMSWKKRLQRSPFWNCTWQPGRVYVTSFPPTRNWREEEKPATGFASFTRSGKCIFPKRLSTSLFSMLPFRSLEHVWLKIIRLIPRAAITRNGGKRLVENHLDKISWTAWLHKKRNLAADYCSNWRKRCSLLFTLYSLLFTLYSLLFTLYSGRDDICSSTNPFTYQPFPAGLKLTNPATNGTALGSLFRPWENKRNYKSLYNRIRISSPPKVTSVAERPE